MNVTLEGPPKSFPPLLNTVEGSWFVSVPIILSFRYDFHIVFFITNNWSEEIYEMPVSQS